MGLNISQEIWQSYINASLDCLQSRKYCEAIMDDLLLFTPSKDSHFNKLEDLLKALRNNGLKISAKKYQLFKTALQYMGNTIFIRNKRVCIKPLRSRIEAIQKLKPPMMIKECRSFVGMVNFVSIFCSELQGLLKPIYDLTWKGRHFIWGEEQQKAFEEIKNRLQRPPVLHLPDKQGRFQLYSDTSKFARGSALYQIQKGQPKLIAYASKRMPETAKNYCVTELEMCGLAINKASFTHLLKKVDFDAVVDHLAITHIMKSKAKLATTQIKRLLKLLSAHSFNLYYIKGKDMVLSDFLSRQKLDNSNPHEIIPLAFSLRNILHESYYRLNNLTKMTESGMNKYMVQTRAQAKSGRTKVPEVHGAKKNLIPHIKPEKSVPSVHPIPPTCHLRPVHYSPHTYQRPPTNTLPPVPKPRIGQGRAGIRSKPRVAPPIPKVIQTPTLPMPMPPPRTVLPLTEPITQSPDSTIPQPQVSTVIKPLI